MTLDLLGVDFIRLTDVELEQARVYGTRRQGYAKGLRHRADLIESDDALANHIIGAAGEIAFARWYGISEFEPTVNTFSHGADVLRFQIRTRRHPGSELIIRPNDKERDIFVLVIALNERVFRMVGWGFGWYFKDDAYISDPGKRGGAYFVPERALQPMATIPREEIVDNAQRVTQ